MPPHALRRAQGERVSNPRTTFATPPPLLGAPAGMWHGAARVTAAVGRVLLLPLVAAGGALAGLVLLVLLPICGITSIAEGVARAAGRRLRAGAHPLPPRILPYD